MTADSKPGFKTTILKVSAFEARVFDVRRIRNMKDIISVPSKFPVLTTVLYMYDPIALQK